MGRHFCKTADQAKVLFQQRVGIGLDGRGWRNHRCGTTCTRNSKHLVTPGQLVIVHPARQTFDQIEAVAQDQCLLVDEDVDVHVRVGGSNVALVDRPVKPGHAVVALDAGALEHDVVARFAVIVGVVRAAVQHVMADDGGVEEQLRVVAGKGVKPVAAFHPVVTLVAHQHRGAAWPLDKVVAFPGRDVLGV